MSVSKKSAPRKIGSIVSQLMSRRGYAEITCHDELTAAVVSVVGPQLGAAVSVGNLRGGVLQIYATDSVTLQELNFQKRPILKRIQEAHPQSNVTDLRFRIQS
jgi:hypothetical protein